MKIEKKLEKYLNQANDITQDYLNTLRILKMTPEEILEIERKELRSIASIIYLCVDMLMFTPHEVCYNGRKFKINLI